MTAGRRAVSRRLRAVRREPGQLRAGHLGREDGQPGRPPHVADVRRATSSRSTWTARCACAATRWAALTDPTHRVGRVAHADVRAPARRSGPRRCRRSCSSRAASRSTASATTTCIRTGIFAERGTAGVVQQRPQERQQHRAPVERVERAARQLPGPLQPARRPTSYVTGSHNIKVGFQDPCGPYRRYNNANADLYQIYKQRRAAPGDRAQHAAADRRSTSTRTSGSTPRIRGT